MIQFLLEYYKKAVNYLRRSSRVKQDDSIKVGKSTEYQFDKFDHDDMAFIELQIKKSSNQDYRIEAGEFLTPTDNCVVLSDKKNRNNLEDMREDFLHSTILHTDEIHSDIAQKGGNKRFLLKQQTTFLKNKTTSEIGYSDLTADWSTDEGIEFIGKKLPLLELAESFEDEFDNQNEDILEEVGESGWINSEDFDDDLDDFDENARREAEEYIQRNGEVSREDRAKQIAVEVLNKSGWDTKHLTLLQQVFVENGWSAARYAIEREIGNGLQPIELALARKLKLFWADNEQYWITFRKIKSNAPFQQTGASYLHLSWPESLRIIRCFPSYPEIEEIYTFIDVTYDHWYNSDRLQRYFKTFLEYLKYKTNPMRYTSPDSFRFSFQNLDDIDSDIEIDNPHLINNPEIQELLELGITLK